MEKKQRGRPKGSKNKPKVTKEVVQEFRDTPTRLEPAGNSSEFKEPEAHALPSPPKKSKKGVGRYLTCTGCDATMYVHFDVSEVGDSKTRKFNCTTCKMEHKILASVRLILKEAM